jgi:hypothetical protein
VLSHSSQTEKQMTSPYIDTSRFHLDYEPPSFASYELCEICGRSFYVDDLEEGICPFCKATEEDAE